MHCFVHLCNVKPRGKGGGGTFKEKYKSEICFHHKRKGSIHISCACANTCLPLFAEEFRGCNVLEMQKARNVCHERCPTDKMSASLYRIDLFTAQVCFATSGKFALTEVVYQLGPKNCFAIIGITLYLISL